MKRCILSTAIVLAFCLPAQALAQQLPAAKGTVVVLVRHAEKAPDGTTDPPLTETGHARARALALMLRDAGITHVFSSDYRRTRYTAHPLADSLGLVVQLYRPRLLADLAEQLKATPGRHLVVGHSNSTHALVDLLGGDPGAKIPEEEYDRLYLLTLGETTQTMVLRYGESGW